MTLTDPRLPAFLEHQVLECGLKVEIDPGGLWLLFALEAGDAESNALARALLTEAPFAYDSGTSEDDQWIVYYVNEANRLAALHWLEDWQKRVAGEIRPVAPEHRALIRQLAGSAMSHRMALQLAELHTRGDLTAGCISDASFLRLLIDRWHLRGSLGLQMFRTLLQHHLVDLEVLLKELLPEDVDLLQDVVMDDSSVDPFDCNRREGAGDVRELLTRFHVISTLDQQANTAITNPYASFVGVTCKDDRVVVPVDGAMVRLRRDHFVAAIRAVRRQLYAGADFANLTTLDSWVTDAMALPFRFIKQRLAIRGEIAPLDWLFIIERAVKATEIPKAE